MDVTMLLGFLPNPWCSMTYTEILEHDQAQVQLSLLLHVQAGSVRV